MSEHSPLPWRIYALENSNALHIDDAGGQDIVTAWGWGEPEDAMRANAAFIVRAVNCHADLLAALKSTLDWLSSFSMPPAATIAEKQDHMAILEAAIAKAEAE